MNCRTVSKILNIATVIVLLCILLNNDTLKRAYNVMTLFHQNKIVENFRSMHKQGFPSKTVQRGCDMSHFYEGELNKYDLPETFTGMDGQELNTMNFLEKYWTTGLVILKVDNDTNAKLMYEQYFRGNDKQTRTISWSTAKSITSALIGIALKEGKIRSIEDRVTDYVPILKNSGYANVKIKDILQMSSGIKFDEDYFNMFSDINRLGLVLSVGRSLDTFTARLTREREPGVYHQYVSSDTQVLGMVLKSAVGSLSQYTEDKLWKKIGAESSAYWILDNDRDQMELAFGGFNAITRDYARFGWLYLNNGRSPLNGESVIDENYVRASYTPDGPHLIPGKRNTSSEILGYGFQWWIPEPKSDDHDYLAIGVYNQFIYVSPKYRIVIARNSAYPNYDQDSLESELNAIECFRAMAKHFGSV